VNTTAFLQLFTLDLWMFLLGVIAAISIWLVLIERENFSKVVFWNYSVLFEQDEDKLSGGGIGRKSVIVLWIFTAILLRNAYNSSLYSFMTTEKEQNDYPRSMNEILNRQDFELLAPEKFRMSFKQLFEKWRVTSREFKMHLPEKLKEFFLDVIWKALYTNDKEYASKLRSIASGKAELVEHLEPYPNEDRLTTFQVYKFVTNYSKIFKFAAMREDWDGKMGGKGGLFFGPSILKQVVPKQNYFYRQNRIWSQDFASFVACPFLTLDFSWWVSVETSNRHRKE